MPVDATFREPTAPERIFNRVFGILVGLGIAPRDYYVLQVRGRKTGRIFSTPVNLVEYHGLPYLVAPRGRTQWVRNAEAAGAITIKRGRSIRTFRVRAVPDAEKAAVLSVYLDRFRTTVQRYFPVRAGSGPAAFAELLGRYPVFELLPSGDPAARPGAPPPAQR